MKRIILAGGNVTELMPLTAVTKNGLLPVDDGQLGYATLVAGPPAVVGEL